MINVKIRKLRGTKTIDVTLPLSRFGKTEVYAMLGIEKGNAISVDECAILGMKHTASSMRNCNSLDELDFMARRITDMSPPQRRALEDLCGCVGIGNMMNLINLTYNVDDYDFLRADTELTDSGLESYCFEYMKSHGGIMYYDGFIDETDRTTYLKPYDGKTLPDIGESDWVFRVTITNRSDNRICANIELPAPQYIVDEAITRAYCTNMSNIAVTNLNSRVPGIGLTDDADLDTLNKLAYTITAMSDEDYVKFAAVLRCENLIPQNQLDSDVYQKMLSCTGQLDGYVLTPELKSAAEYGEALLIDKGIPNTVIRHVDLEAYGAAELYRIGGIASDFGVVYKDPAEQTLTHDSAQQMNEM